jgi:hypothetical protein
MKPKNNYLSIALVVALAIGTTGCDESSLENIAKGDPTSSSVISFNGEEYPHGSTVLTGRFDPLYTGSVEFQDACLDMNKDGKCNKNDDIMEGDVTQNFSLSSEDTSEDNASAETKSVKTALSTGSRYLTFNLSDRVLAKISEFEGDLLPIIATNAKVDNKPVGFDYKAYFPKALVGTNNDFALNEESTAVSELYDNRDILTAEELYGKKVNLFDLSLSFEQPVFNFTTRETETSKYDYANDVKDFMLNSAVKNNVYGELIKSLRKSESQVDLMLNLEQESNGNADLTNYLTSVNALFKMIETIKAFEYYVVEGEFKASLAKNIEGLAAHDGNVSEYEAVEVIQRLNKYEGYGEIEDFFRNLPYTTAVNFGVSDSLWTRWLESLAPDVIAESVMLDFAKKRLPSDDRILATPLSIDDYNSLVRSIGSKDSNYKEIDQYIIDNELVKVYGETESRKIDKISAELLWPKYLELHPEVKQDLNLEEFLRGMIAADGSFLRTEEEANELEKLNFR